MAGFKQVTVTKAGKEYFIRGTKYTNIKDTISALLDILGVE